MTTRMVQRWSTMLLLVAAWLLLQQGAWHHVLGHVHAHEAHAGHHAHDHTHEHPGDHHASHSACDLCLSLQTAHAALSGLALDMPPLLVLHDGRTGWSLSHAPTLSRPWHKRSRAPPMTEDHTSPITRA